ncbi:hypothetical protein RAS1_28830 [Phycisphaerae bacterium RAS1]|nr:hypothetical protein RAS1_28830 [Phycisphaerae bacterium RAS1]
MPRPTPISLSSIPFGNFRFSVLALGALCTLLASAGCAVPQPRGEGRLTREVEPSTGRGYWRYLPKDYVAADESVRRSRRWPTVVTFHGMKPFDSAKPQALEWEQEADRYGFVVVAPELDAPDVFREFPLRSASAAFKSDETATLAVLNHLFSTTGADPSNVLATSWSSGGYSAHYMLNMHPDRFTCLAVRQSNCAVTLLDEKQVARSRYHPILIVFTENDFRICREESLEAIRWYEGHGYRNNAWVKIKDLGHERTPDMAAFFFSLAAGVKPSRPPEVLARRQAIDGNPNGLAVLAGKVDALVREPALADASSGQTGRLPTPARPTNMLTRGGPAAEPVRPVASAPPSAASVPPTAARQTGLPARTPPKLSPLSIRVSSAIGVEPLHVGFWAECPSDWQRSAEFQWMIDGQPIASGVNGQSTFRAAGDHTLGLRVLTAEGEEHRAYRQIRVIEAAGASRAGGE